MSEGNRYGVRPQVLKELEEHVKEAFAGSTGEGEFEPFRSYDPRTDTLTVMFENCSHTEEQHLRSFITVLRKNHDPDKGKEVGIMICGWSRLKEIL